MKVLQIGAETPNQGQGTTQSPSTRVQGTAPHPLPWGQDPVQGPHQAQLRSHSPTPCWQRAIFQRPVARQRRAENELMLQMFSSSMSNAYKGGNWVRW